MKHLFGIFLFFALSTLSSASVISTQPLIDEPNAPMNIVIAATFDEAMDPTSFTESTFKLKIHKNL
ncbi:MAG: hypothetical protein ABFR02_08565 [Campylobacterota bacterium]